MSSFQRSAFLWADPLERTYIPHWRAPFRLCSHRFRIHSFKDQSFIAGFIIVEKSFFYLKLQTSFEALC